MKVQRKSFSVGLLMAAAVLLASVIAAGAQPSPAPTQAPAAPQGGRPPASGINPRAESLLTQVCQALGSADAFSFHAEVMFDKVLPGAVKVQFAGAMDVVLQRPNELAINYQSDLGGKQVWYQNNTLTVFDPQHSMYATLPVPNSIDGMLSQVAQENHLTLPLADLAYTDPCQRVRKEMIYGDYIGVNDVDGIACDHIAFSSRTTDLQLWLERAGKPLPRKIVINYRSVPGSPEYIAFLSDWKFPKEIAASEFTPVLPKDAKKIGFLKIKEKQP